MKGITNIQSIFEHLKHVDQGEQYLKNIFRYQKEFSRLIKPSLNRFTNRGQNCQQDIYLIQKQVENVLQYKNFNPKKNQYINQIDYLFKNLFKKQVPKYQSVKKLIDQNKNILKKDQNFFTKLANSQIQIPNVCLCCLSQVHLNQQLIENQNQKIFPIEKFVLNEPQNDQILKKYICSMLNAGQGMIMIGVSKQLKVKGLQLQNSQILQIKQKIKDIRKSWIFPEYQQNQQKQIFRLEVIQISPSRDQTSQEPQNPSYIIKIYANTRHWQLTHPFIQNKEKQIFSNIPNIYKSYGQIPNKIYAYDSIVVVQDKDFIQQFNSDIQSLVIHQIFQKFIPNTNRTVYYMTHRHKYQQIKARIQKVDPKKRKNLDLMKITRHLTFSNQQQFAQAQQKLKQRFQLCFQKELRAIQRHYFSFDSQIQAIFAFTLLQNSNIRSNFVQN